MASAPELTKPTADSHAVEESSHPANASATQNLSAAPASPISPAKSLTAVQSIFVEVLHDNSAPTVANNPEVGQTAPSDTSSGATCNVDSPSDGSTAIDGGNAGDVVMQDATSHSSSPLGTQIDEDLPGWLAPMIGYLRGVSEEAAWQDLVTEFVGFEKCGPPPGVSSFYFRHNETD